MTANTGRTVDKYVTFLIDDSGGTLREIPVDSIGGVGLTYEEFDLTAFQDAVKGVLLGQPDASLTITGPFDTTVAGTPPTLSGSHTVLSAIDGGNTPLAFDVRIGIRHTWEAGEPTFGITGTTTAGCLVSDYQFTGAGKYSAKLRIAAGSTAPVWATAAHT